MSNEIKIGGGLLPTPKDIRDYKYEKVFGAVEKLPEEDFMVAEPLEIKDQKDDDSCVGRATATVSELQEGMPCSGEYQFAKIKQIEGDWQTYGSDLRIGAKSAVKFGSLPNEKVPDKIKNVSRNEFANWENWNFMSDLVAAQHKKQSYFRINQIGYADLFDSLRGAMWQQKKYKRTILTGALWRQSWTEAKNGIIPTEYEEGGFGHAFAFIGQKRISGLAGDELYLVAQLSNGKEIGDNGLFYFPRDVINRECVYGNFMFIDKDPEKYKKESWTFWQKFTNFLRKISK